MIEKHISISNILIVGLARNCEAVIANEIKNINKAFSSAKNIEWIIVESDSNDRTSEVIKNLAKKYSINLISLGNLIDEFPKRTARIAFCRNTYVEEINNNNLYSNIDYVVVADLDGVNNKINSNSVNSCWETNLNWDACFANQSAPYYDIWALRHKIWSPNDCNEQAKFLREFSSSQSASAKAAIYSKMITIPSNSNPIKVDSAFGGIGIYKKDAFKLGKYKGQDKKENQVCEHIHFNECLTKAGKILIINPKFINGGWNEHNRKYTRTLRLKSKLIESLISFVTLFISKEKIKNIIYSK